MFIYAFILRVAFSFLRTCTPIIDSIGTSVRGILTACGGKYIGARILKSHSKGI